jgi:hypothetical protein
MNFGDFGFPGAYPNDAGVNIMHDDFLGFPQPETKALLSLTASEMPDLILNMHTGVPKRKYFMQLYREFIEPAYTPLYEQAYKKIKTALTRAGLQESDDVEAESDPSWVKMNGYNLSTALNLNCGALNILIESPSHGYQGTNSKGVATAHTPETLLDAQLIAHQEAIRFLVETGGRTGWEKSFAK